MRYEQNKVEYCNEPKRMGEIIRLEREGKRERERERKGGREREVFGLLHTVQYRDIYSKR